MKHLSIIGFVLLSSCTSEVSVEARKSNTLSSLNWSTKNPDENIFRDKAVDIVKSSTKKTLSAPNIYDVRVSKRGDEFLVLIRWISVKPYAMHVKIRQNNHSVVLSISEEDKKRNVEVYEKEKIMLYDASILINKDTLANDGIKVNKSLEVVLLNEELKEISNKFQVLLE